MFKIIIIISLFWSLSKIIVHLTISVSNTLQDDAWLLPSSSLLCCFLSSQPVHPPAPRSLPDLLTKILTVLCLWASLQPASLPHIRLV